MNESRKAVDLGVAYLAAVLIIHSGYATVAESSNAIETFKIGHIVAETDSTGKALAERATMGAELALEETNVLAGYFGKRFILLSKRSKTPKFAQTIAEQLIREENVIAIVGTIDDRSATLISKVAEQSDVPFFNCGSRADALRNENCGRYTFHSEASNSMYVEALGQWLIYKERAARWYFLTTKSPIDQEIYAIAKSYLEENGGAEVGHAEVDRAKRDFSAELVEIDSLSPAVVFLTLKGQPTTDFLQQFLRKGLSSRVVLPSVNLADVEKEAFQAAPIVWPALWYDGLFRYSARELNSRFRKKFNQPMDSRAWANWAAVKMIGEAVVRTADAEGPHLVRYFESEPPFDGHKGESLTFRYWNHQLRQPIYLLAPSSSVGDSPRLRLELTTQVPVSGIEIGGDRIDSIGISQSDTGCAFEPL